MTVKNWVPYHLEDKPGLSNVWLASTLPKKTFLKHCSKRTVQVMDLERICNEIKNNTISSLENKNNKKTLNLATSTRLITGSLEIAKIQDDILQDDIEKLIFEMSKISTKTRSKKPVEDFPEISIDLPIVNPDADELTLIQYSPQHIKSITMDENTLFCENDITFYDEPINNLEFSSDIPRDLTVQQQEIDEQSEEYFIEKRLPQTPKRKSQLQSSSRIPAKRLRTLNYDTQQDYQLPDSEPCINLPPMDEPSIPNETIHKHVETVEPIQQKQATVTSDEQATVTSDEQATVASDEQAKIPDEVCTAPAVTTNAEQPVDDTDSNVSDTPPRRTKKRCELINEVDVIPVETLYHRFKNIQLRVLNFEDCKVPDVQHNHNTLINLKRHPGYIWQEERFTQISIDIEHFFTNNVMVQRDNTLEHQRSQETHQNIHQDVSNLLTSDPVQDSNITSQNNEKSQKQIFPNEILQNQQETNLNTLEEPTVDLLQTQEITDEQLAETQLITQTEQDKEQNEDDNLNNQLDKNVDVNVDLSMYEDAPAHGSPESSSHSINKIEVEERLNMCKEKNLFPLYFNDLFPPEVDSKTDAILGFYHLLDIAGENGNEFNLFQKEQLLVIECCPKDFPYSY